MKLQKNREKIKYIKNLVINRYRSRIQRLKKQLVTAIKNYKDAVDAERIAALKK